MNHQLLSKTRHPDRLLPFLDTYHTSRKLGRVATASALVGAGVAPRRASYRARETSVGCASGLDLASFAWEHGPHSP